MTREGLVTCLQPDRSRVSNVSDTLASGMASWPRPSLVIFQQPEMFRVCRWWRYWEMYLRDTSEISVQLSDNLLRFFKRDFLSNSPEM